MDIGHAESGGVESIHGPPSSGDDRRARRVEHRDLRTVDPPERVGAFRASRWNCNGTMNEMVNAGASGSAGPRSRRGCSESSPRERHPQMTKDHLNGAPTDETNATTVATATPMRTGAYLMFFIGTLSCRRPVDCTASLPSTSSVQECYMRQHRLAERGQRSSDPPAIVKETNPASVGDRHGVPCTAITPTRVRSHSVSPNHGPSSRPNSPRTQLGRATYPLTSAPTTERAPRPN